MAVPPCTIPTGSFELFDFQGLSLDLVSTFGPIITDTRTFRFPIPLSQQWELTTVNNGRVLASGLSQEAGEAIVVAMGSNMQAFGATNTNIAFNVTCVPVDDDSITLVDNVLGLALTASQAGANGSDAPVTFQPFTGSSEQIWSFEALD
ncbi:hypothetical protein B0H19DRAFT_1267319 [Mycena capillaripes]|nr:hypothetical protein B0H19DRAFT_1267319 [Mycena capillaripes]